MNIDSKAPTSASSPAVTLLVVSLVQFLVPYMGSAVNIALPSIGHDLKASAVQLSLTVTVYILATAIFLLPVGRFSDIYGRKKIFVIGLVVLTVSSLLLGFSPSIQVFLVLRFVQGVGSALVLTASIAILTMVFPPERRGRAIGITTSMVYVGLTLGPSLSGFIVNYLGWHWVFYIVFGCCVAVIVLTLLFLKGEWKSAEGEPFDYTGSVLFMLSFCLLVLGASRFTVDPDAKLILVGGLIGLVLFCFKEWRTEYPLLDLRFLLNNLGFSFSNLATFLNYASVTSFTFLFSLYLQYVKGLSPREAGLLLIVQPVIQSILAPLAGRLADKYPPSIIATIGMGFCTLGLAGAAFIDIDASYAYIVIVMIFLGFSLGLFSTPNMTAIMNSVGPRQQGTASAMVATMRTLGMLFSATAIAVILSIYMGDAQVKTGNIPDFIASMQTGLFLFSGLSLIGTFFSAVKGRIAGGSSE